MLIIEPNNLLIRNNNFDIEGNYQIKVVFFSDIHIGQQRPGYLEDIVTKVNAQNPDIILIGGDIIDRSESELALLEPLKNLKSKYGTYAVLGNHDYGNWGCGMPTGLGEKVAEKLSELKITVLRNDNRMVTANGTKIAIVGLDDAWMCLEDYQKAIIGLDNISKIIVAHNQFAMEEEEMEENFIVLSGHTHCSQIRIPILSDLVLEPFFGKIGGQYAYGNGTLYVSCGVASGTVRFLAPPEINVIQLE
ncbi:MAG: metallophosphoesterase [Candidatus Micrarchaeota archaeon]